ncbi:hypothetical protein IC229_05740 [Spirosoma sp. BT702]|uniref:Uncharacterized protein n=1 Tax=Spirosoma profusum TaxID=2771354 RepID=A0A926XY16_9BACT|nr:hypothetical protein [Spirosoma profusum]MBD2700127.1 hypothetical protein [Spirosoma profusum]
MNKKQAEQFNNMLSTLKKIAKDYQSPYVLSKNSQKLYGLDYEEALEMAYENIQGDAARAIQGVNPVTIEAA